MTSVVGVVAGLGLAATTLPGIAASAAPGSDELPTLAGEPTTKPDNFHDPLAAKRTALRQRAVDELVAGTAETQGKGRNRTIALADGTEVDYPVTQTSQLLTFLIEFGDGAGNPDFPDNTAGPTHNAIPEPARSDNSTYWEHDFSRQHYLDMFFNGLADQGGESFHDVYDEMSSGRFDLKGDVSDWVSVDHPAAYYQELQDADNEPETPSTGEETGAVMTKFLQDGSDAWYADQLKSKTPAEITDYLKTFDVWDRYDFDQDGNFNEPDGYVDHFQAIHAGEGEEAGADTWAIWSHRSSVNSNGDVGPAGNKAGGVQIGDTGLWIRDYTTEPENGGLGVFAHEFGHDLGLPDYYDTNGGDNGTGFWNLMSSGSWMGHGTGTTGTTPNHMGATEKLFLGWYGNDLATVDGTGAPQEVVLGPSVHASTKGKQAVAVTLPDGSSTVDVVTPDDGKYLYSENGDDRAATATSPLIDVPADNPILRARVSFSIEDDWDYAYLKVSDDGGATWDYVETNLSTSTDPNQQNEGFGITGCSGERPTPGGECDDAWTDLTAELVDYAGEQVKIQFEMVNDAAYHELGFSVDSVELGDQTLTDVEDGAPTWTLAGFRVMDGASYVKTYPRYYVAENRQYRGYDATLAQGPYSSDYPVTAPNRVDQFPYQDGLLVWYANGLYADNNTSDHPGEGAALPVDANPAYVRWQKAGVNAASASGRLSAYDATFDVDQTDGLHLTNESLGGTTYDVASRPSIPVFEDTNPNAYWDNATPRASWYSTRVAGAGTMIQVLSSDETTGKMVVKVGRKFVATTSPATVTGTPIVGQTLTAGAPAYFHTGVTSGYQWLADGAPIAGATGSSYTLRPADTGKKVSVAVTGTKADYLSGTSTSAAGTAVQPATAGLTVKAPKKVKKGAKAKVAITVSSAGATPTGKVRLSWGGKKVMGTLTGGTVTVKLPAARKKGKQKLAVTYLPDTGFTATSTKVTIKVM